MTSWCSGCLGNNVHIADQIWLADCPGWFKKGKSSAPALTHVKITIKFLKTLNLQLWINPLKNLIFFELNLQSTLSLKEIRQGKTKETLV